MRDLYYFEAAKSILHALNEEGDSRIVMARALRLGCKATRKMVADLSSGGDLDWAIQHLTSQDMFDKSPEAVIPRHSEGVTIVGRSHDAGEKVSDAGALLNAFLSAEREAMFKAGVPYTAVDFIHGEAREAIELLERALSSKLKSARPNWDRLRQAVTELSKEVCDQAQSLEDDQKTRKYLKKGVYALCGAGTIKMNVSVDIITTLGLLPWMTAWSGKLGAALWARAAGLIPFPGEK
jgi:hypothetical protein